MAEQRQKYEKVSNDNLMKIKSMSADILAMLPEKKNDDDPENEFVAFLRLNAEKIRSRATVEAIRRRLVKV